MKALEKEMAKENARNPHGRSLKRTAT